AEVVWRGRALGKDTRRPAQADHDFRAGYGQRLPGADVERHALPAPGVDVEPQGGKGFYLRIRCHAGFFAVPPELTADQVSRLQRRDGFQDLDFLIPHRFTVRSDGRLHGQVGQDLE